MYRRDAAEQRGGPTRAARAVECAHGTDKALGEPQLSRPLTRAAATPSTGVCAPPMCRHPCTSALTRMLACHMRLCLGRLFYTLKGYGVEFIHPEACLVVLVAGQRSQASLSARGAVNVLGQDKNQNRPFCAGSRRPSSNWTFKYSLQFYGLFVISRLANIPLTRSSCRT